MNMRGSADQCVRNGKLEKGEFTRGRQIAMGAWENTQRDQVVAIPRSSELWSAQAAILHRVSITNDKMS